MRSRSLTTLALAGLALALATSANAGSLTTLFAQNNGGSAGGMVYFDLTVGSQALTITGFDTNASLASGTFGFSVYTIVGSYVGNTGSSGLWTLQTTGTGTAAGINNPSSVSLVNSFNLNANTTYGIALGMGPESGHEYTNGNGTNQAYSNSDLSLSLGAASNTQFNASVFSPRVWNGTIYYTPVPEPATIAALGLGAALLIRRRRR